MPSECHLGWQDNLLVYSYAYLFVSLFTCQLVYLIGCLLVSEPACTK